MAENILVCDSTCERCGTKYSEPFHRISYRYCGKWLCDACCNACEHHRKHMLPNGTYCMRAHAEESYRYRLLSRPILASESDIAAAVPKYEAEKRTGILFEMFAVEARLYSNVDQKDTEERARRRVKLAAMQRVLLERVMSNPISKRLYERLNGLI